MRLAMSQARLRKILHESLLGNLLRSDTEVSVEKLSSFINGLFSCLKSTDYSKNMTPTPFVLVLDSNTIGTGESYFNPNRLTHVLTQWGFETGNILLIDYAGKAIKDSPYDKDVINGDDDVSQFSLINKLVLVYIHQLSLKLYVHGIIYYSTENIHEAKRSGEVRRSDLPPSQYRLLIEKHFKEKYLEGKSFDNWAVKKDRVLKPKPENFFRNRLFDYLKDNLTVEGFPEKEITVGSTEDKIDIRITDFENNEFILIEIKWVGKARKESKKESKKDETTEYGDEKPNEGLEQLFIYLDTHERVKCGCLLTYDVRDKDEGVIWNKPSTEWHNKLDKPPMTLYLKSESASKESKKRAQKSKKNKGS